MPAKAGIHDFFLSTTNEDRTLTPPDQSLRRDEAIHLSCLLHQHKMNYSTESARVKAGAPNNNP
jgi:hypothetical protein